MRLADTILSTGLAAPPGWVAGHPDPAGVEVSVQAAVHAATIVEATNVYRYCRELPATPLYDLPCGAPPHDILFVEWKQNNGKICGALGMIRHPPFRIGLHEPEAAAGANGFRTLRPPKLNLSGKVDAIPMWLSNNLPDQQAWDRVRWTWGVGIFQQESRRAYGPIATVRAALDEWGRLIDVAWVVHFDLEEGTNVDPFTLHPFTVFLTTINFMQCANIETVYVDPPAALSRKHRKRGNLNPGQELVRYHVLKVRRGPASRTKGTSRSSQDLLPFHPVRGGFHHYGNCCPGLHEPKGLYFGKHEGRVWVPSHVSGNPERGVIKRDFVVEP